MLRWRGGWLALGAGFVALVVYLSLAASAPDVGRMGEVKVGHFLAYAWLMFWYMQLFARLAVRLSIAAALALMGAGLEYLQALTPHRTFGYEDMRDNALGVLAGLALGTPVGPRILARIESLLGGRSA